MAGIKAIEKKPCELHGASLEKMSGPEKSKSRVEDPEPKSKNLAQNLNKLQDVESINFIQFIQISSFLLQKKP